MPGARNGAGAAVARHHVEKLLRWMRPDILNVGAGRGDGVVPNQRRAFDVDVVAGKLWPDALVEHRLGHHSAPLTVCADLYIARPVERESKRPTSSPL